MKLGMLLPTVHSIALNQAALRAGEALGVDDVWLLDHMMGLTHPAIWPDFPAAAALPDPDALLDPSRSATTTPPRSPTDAQRVLSEQLPHLKRLLTAI
jgi:phthiodiolone/phenolphthiodiolone dimycocerosates ketoreductase